MKPPIIITSDKTRLNALESRFDNLGCFRLSRYGSEWDEPGLTIVLDASFDIYDPEVRAKPLRTLLAGPENPGLSHPRKNFYVVREYPFFLERQAALRSRPHLDSSSRRSRSITARKSSTFRSSSRDTPSTPERPRVVDHRRGEARQIREDRLPGRLEGGYRLRPGPARIDHGSLRELRRAQQGRRRFGVALDSVSSIAQSIAGEAPLRFDVKNFVHYRYPEDAPDAVGQVNYGLENMMIDLIDKLF
jgi:hypothetical protein